MPSVRENGRIDPSFRPEDNTVEGFADGLRKLDEILSEKYSTRDDSDIECPVDIEPFFSNKDIEELKKDPCPDDEIQPYESPEIKEPEIEDLTECIQNGVQAIHDAAKEIAADAQKLSDINEILPKIEEWLYSLEAIYAYHKERYDSSNRKLALSVLSDEVKNTLKVTTFPAYLAASELYTTGLQFGVFNMESVIKANFHYHWTDDINSSDLLTSNEKKYLTGDINNVLTVKKYNSKIHARGKLFSEYYDLMENPEDNFFTVEERGLVRDSRMAYTVKGDERIEVKTSNHIEVKSNGKVYYVGNNTNKLQNGKTRYQMYSEFYTELFPNEFDNRKLNKMEKLRKTLVYTNMISIAKSIGKTEGSFKTKYSELHKNSKKFIERYESVKKLYDRLKSEADKIKKLLTKDAITERVNNKTGAAGCDGLFTIPRTDTPVIDNDSLDGIAAYLSPTGGDPKLPDYTKLCYWLKFCELATIYNATSPYPDVMKPTSMRYWPVGIVIPTPAKLIKIPFPTVFLPLLVLSTKVGTFVLFLAQTGIFPALDILMISNDGSKNFILGLSVSSIKSGTVQSENFGFDFDSEMDLYKYLPKIKMYMLPIINEFDKIDIAAKRDQFRNRMNEYVYSKLDIDYDMDEAMENPLKILDTLNKWQSDIKLRISQIPDKEVDIDLSAIDQVRQFVKDEMNKVNWPVFEFPKEMKNLEQNPPVIDAMKGIKDLIDVDCGIVNRPETLRDVIVDFFSGLYDDSRLQELLSKIPDEIDLSEKIANGVDKFKERNKESVDDAGEAADNAKAAAEDAEKLAHENLRKFKDFMNDALDWVAENLNRNIWDNKDIDMANLSLPGLSNPLQCDRENDISLPELDVILVLIGTAKSLIASLTLDQIRQILPPGMLKFSRSQALGVLTSVFTELIPPIPMIDIKGTMQSLTAAWDKLVLGFTKKMTEISNITIDQVKDLIYNKVVNMLGLPIRVDTRMFVDPIVNVLMQFYNSAVAGVEKYDGQKLTTAMLKGFAYDAVDQVFSPVSDAVRIYIELYEKFVVVYKTVKAIKNMNIDFNPVDLAVNPKETLKKIAKKIVDAPIVEEIRKKLKLDKLVIDPELYKIAVALLEEKFEPLFEYHLIGMACAFGGENAAKVIRSIHPISMGEDLPPYERLKLTNPLFVLFLDGFCYNAKKLNGYSENYL